MGRGCEIPRRLAIIVNSELVGGHEMQLVHLARAMERDGPVALIASSAAGEKFFSEHGFIVRFVPFSRSGKIWRQWYAASAFSAKLAPAIADCAEVMVSGGTIEACVAPARAVKLLRPDSVVTAYLPMYIDRARIFGFIGRVYNCASRAFVTAIDHFITVNRIQARLIAHCYKRPVSVARNVIDPIEVPMNDLGPRLIFVGRLDDGQKDVSGLISLLDHHENPYDTLHIFGDGPDRAVVENAANSARRINVVFHGWMARRQLAFQLGKRDLLILNSRWEGEPMIVRELKAAGIQAIGSDIYGLRGLLPRTHRFANRAQLLALLKQRHRDATGGLVRRSGW